MKKYTIFSPNKEYIGVAATVGFVQGKGETDSDYLADWFKKKGYTVVTSDEVSEIEEEKVAEEAKEKELTEAKLKKMNSAELDELGVELSVDLSECQNKAEKVDKIWEAFQNKGE